MAENATAIFAPPHACAIRPARSHVLVRSHELRLFGKIGSWLKCVDAVNSAHAGHADFKIAGLLRFDHTQAVLIMSSIVVYLGCQLRSR